MSDPLDLYGIGVPTSAVKKAHIYSPPPLVRRRRSVPLEPLTQEKWDKMEGKARWDSIVALRGPDLVGSDTLKWFTSSVIRWRLSHIMRVGGLVNNTLGFVLLPSGGWAGKNVAPFDISHFLGHIHEAADWLEVPIVWCSQATFELTLQQSKWGSSQEAVLCALREELSKTKDPNLDRVNSLLGISQESIPCE
jgi:hypothetical protein